jgi:hypothetical protein
VRFWTIGDGRSVNWFHDAWIDEGLRVSAMNLNIPHHMKDLKVVHFVVGSEIKCNWQIGFQLAL